MLTVDGRIIFLSSIRKYLLKYMHKPMQWNSCCTYDVSYIPLQFLYWFFTTCRQIPQRSHLICGVSQYKLLFSLIFNFSNIFIYCLTARGWKKPNKNLQRNMVVCRFSSIKVLIWLIAEPKILVNCRVRPLYYLF